MTKVTVKCALCGKAFQRSESQIRENNFCCREHFYKWNSQRMTEYNRTDNPMNKPGGVMGVLSGVASSVAPAKERHIPSYSANTRTAELPKPYSADRSKRARSSTTSTATNSTTTPQTLRCSRRSRSIAKYTVSGRRKAGDVNEYFQKSERGSPYGNGLAQGKRWYPSPQPVRCTMPDESKERWSSRRSRSSAFGTRSLASLPPLITPSPCSRAAAKRKQIRSGT